MIFLHEDEQSDCQSDCDGDTLRSGSTPRAGVTPPPPGIDSVIGHGIVSLS